MATIGLRPTTQTAGKISLQTDDAQQQARLQTIADQLIANGSNVLALLGNSLFNNFSELTTAALAMLKDAPEGSVVVMEWNRHPVVAEKDSTPQSLFRSLDEGYKHDAKIARAEAAEGLEKTSHAREGTPARPQRELLKTLRANANSYDGKSWIDEGLKLTHPDEFRSFVKLVAFWDDIEGLQKLRSKVPAGIEWAAIPAIDAELAALKTETVAAGAARLQAPGPTAESWKGLAQASRDPYRSGD